MVSESPGSPRETECGAPSHAMEPRRDSSGSQAGTESVWCGPESTVGVGAAGPASLVQYSQSPSSEVGQEAEEGDISFPFGVFAPAAPSCPARRVWSRQQKRVYQESMSFLTFWQTHGYGVIWVMLSSAYPGGLETLTRHFQRLREEIERKLGYPGLEFLAVKTREGHGVIHAFLAWKGDRLFFIPQPWLSQTWKRIHGAPIVWVAAVKRGGTDRRRLSKYVVNQYLANQNALVRLSSSSMRTFGFGLRRVWAEFRKRTLPVARVPQWSAFLAGERILFGDGSVWDLESVRAGWKTWVKPR
jgi:hypothetical protein